MMNMADFSWEMSWNMEVPAKVESIPPVTDFLITHLKDNGAQKKAVNQISVATDELLSNISYYAYPETENGMAKVTLQIDPKAHVAAITFEDRGIPYNPLEKEDPDISSSLEEKAIGGLGIFLVKKSMDGLEYHREGDRNLFTLLKRF